MRVSLTAAACALLHVAGAGAAPEVIAHRGASGYLPEHTLAAYALAYAQGADWIEPDVVLARDGVLIAAHDITLDATTDVAERFPARARADGRHYAIDFDWREIETLYAIERLPNRFPREARFLRVPRMEQVLDLVQGLNHTTGCRVGVYPEIKSSAFHWAAQADPERRLLQLLNSRGLSGADDPVRIQSFEPPSLARLREYGSAHYLVQLVDDDPNRPTPIDLAAIARYAQAISPAKTRLRREPGLVAQAHAAGLDVHTWTLRADQPGEGFASFEAELDWVRAAGIDAFFTDFPDRAARHLGTARTCVRHPSVPDTLPATS